MGVPSLDRDIMEKQAAQLTVTSPYQGNPGSLTLYRHDAGGPGTGDDRSEAQTGGGLTVVIGRC